MKIIKVESCGGCPLASCWSTELVDCRKTRKLGIPSKKIHPDCPLEDLNTVKTRYKYAGRGKPIKMDEEADHE